ncbi:uncharacterized protein LOC144739218 [Lampetra planeri]
MSSRRLRRPLPALRLLVKQECENLDLPLTGKARVSVGHRATGLSVNSNCCPASAGPVNRRALVDANRKDAAPGKVSVGSGKAHGDGGGDGGGGGGGCGGGGGGAIIGKMVTAVTGAVDGGSASQAKPRVEPPPPVELAEKDFPDIETMLAWSPLDDDCWLGVPEEHSLGRLCLSGLGKPAGITQAAHGNNRHNNNNHNNNRHNNSDSHRADRTATTFYSTFYSTSDSTSDSFCLGDRWFDSDLWLPSLDVPSPPSPPLPLLPPPPSP